MEIDNCNYLNKEYLENLIKEDKTYIEISKKISKGLYFVAQNLGYFNSHIGFRCNR